MDAIEDGGEGNQDNAHVYHSHQRGYYHIGESNPFITQSKAAAVTFSVINNHITVFTQFDSPELLFYKIITRKEIPEKDISSYTI